MTESPDRAYRGPMQNPPALSAYCWSKGLESLVHRCDCARPDAESESMIALVPCPCGSQKLQTVCCGPYVQGTATAPTAEALMRSRYTAFCLGQVDYLIATQHPRRRHRQDRAILSHTIQTTTWLGLTIVATRQGQPQQTQGVVEFVAHFQNLDGTGQLHERSRFLQEQGQWFYVDGDILPPLLPKRGEPCWCGSGKKFKHCHGGS